MQAYGTDSPRNVTSEAASDEYMALQAYALSELRRLAERREEYEHEAERNDFLLRVLRRAVYSAYRDCQDLGLEGEARQVLGISSRAGAAYSIHSPLGSPESRNPVVF
ncbi:MAG: hypothetical protein HY684_00405 [Chloroflexi bacterium]|nr:hypothetical protein [Chloroflexota bacterium]